MRTRSCFWRGNCLSARGRPPFLRSACVGVELLDVEFEEAISAGVVVPDVVFDENELDVEFDKATSARKWRELIDWDDLLRGEPSLSFCCLLATWSSVVLRRLRFACDDVIVKTEPCLGACCSNIFSSSINAVCSWLRCDGEFAVNGKPLLNFCCLRGPWSLAVEVRLRFVAFRATSAPTVAMVLTSKENSIVKSGPQLRSHRTQD